MQSLPSQRRPNAVTLQDGRPLSVNTLEDAHSTEAFETPISGHRGRAWRFQTAEKHDTSLAYTAVSQDDDNPEEYLITGWWAYFPDRGGLWRDASGAFPVRVRAQVVLGHPSLRILKLPASGAVKVAQRRPIGGVPQCVGSPQAPPRRPPRRSYPCTR